jgi:hypothetical protein
MFSPNYKCCYMLAWMSDSNTGIQTRTGSWRNLREKRTINRSTEKNTDERNTTSRKNSTHLAQLKKFT